MDIAAAALAYAFLKFEGAVVNHMFAKGFLHAHTQRKIHHIAYGVIPMSLWPMISKHYRGRLLISCVPFLKVAIGLFSRTFELHHYVESSAGRYQSSTDFVLALVGGMATTIFTTVFFWTSPIGISTLCNFFVGDGMAGLVGRQFGNRLKLPYNENKSFAGTIGMAYSGFLASILFTSYFSRMGLVESELNSNMIYGFMVVSIASALVESHPWSSLLDDNFTVPLTSIIVGSFLF